ncbi:Atxe2 family lasso peptide isopeptidase [Pseudothauera nasutitermitis]|uniref:Atxe2 family lasso peptide isopeptidase n=2 Tax=Pseudothauera nasutitermitis TaxID=2565930 RepID=A0A4S4AZ69_9RHOO|nr:Atxe2 family lasso peptide isopeptidase [Pseudothauera nasutitermitis]
MRTLLLAALLIPFHVSRVEAASIRQLVEVIDFSGASVSPDGHMVAFRTEQASIERNTYDTVWYVQPSDGTSPPRRLGDGGEPLRHGGVSVGEVAKWSPDGLWIFYRAVFDGRVDVWRAAVDGSRTEPVTRDPANVREFSLSADGTTLIYRVGATREDVVNAELAEYDSGVLVDRSLPLGDNVFRSAYHEGRLSTQRLIDRGGLDHLPLLELAPSRWKAIELSTGTKSDLSPDDVPVSPLTPPDLSQNLGEIWQATQDTGSGRVAILTRTGEGNGLLNRPTVELAVLSGLDARQPMKCMAELCTNRPISDILWRPRSDEVLFTVSDPDKGLGQSIFRWNVDTGGVLPVAESRGEMGGGGRWRPGACAPAVDALICVAAEADRPPRIERVDLESGERKVLFEPNVALARDMAESAPVHLLSWTDVHGTRFAGQFFPATSTGDKPPPLFVVYYRCSGFLRGGVGDEWPLATLARNGVSTLCINAAPYKTDAIERYDTGRLAIESAVDFLASRGDIDPERVGVGGLSMGAEVAIWTTMYSRVPRAVSVATPGISPNLLLLFSLWEDTHLSRLKRYWQLGELDKTPERWRQISPSFNPKQLNAPVLMQLSEQEYRVSLDYAVQMIRTHQADVYVFPHEPHQKFQPRHKLAVYERNLDWFLFWLQDIEDADPRKANQYARWRLMRETNLAMTGQ